jgi:hypothetical protein
MRGRPLYETRGRTALEAATEKGVSGLEERRLRSRAAFYLPIIAP